MTSKLLIRNGASSTAQPTASKWIAHEAKCDPFHRGIVLPPTELVKMMHGLMLRVQAGLQPHTTWHLTDNWIQYIITLRWQSPTAQLQLSATLDRLGIWLWLDADCNRNGHLATWRAEREAHPSGSKWFAQYGDLRIYRSTGQGRNFATTSLRFDDPVFSGIPRYRSGYDWQRPKEDELPELGADVIAVTQDWLYAAGIATHPARR